MCRNMTSGDFFSERIPAWISNHIASEVSEEITYPFSNLNGAVEGFDKKFHLTFILDVIT